MWFSVSVLFRGVHVQSNNKEDMWEESIYLIEAINAEDVQRLDASSGKYPFYSFK